MDKMIMKELEKIISDVVQYYGFRIDVLWKPGTRMPRKCKWEDNAYRAESRIQVI